MTRSQRVPLAMSHLPHMEATTASHTKAWSAAFSPHAVAKMRSLAMCREIDDEGCRVPTGIGFD